MFRVAAQFGASCHVHMRNAWLKEPASSIQALEEVIAAAAITGAPLHVVHIQSTGVIDRSTYQEPAKYAEGIKYVLVNGVVVRQGRRTANRHLPWPAGTRFVLVGLV